MDTLHRLIDMAGHDKFKLLSKRTSKRNIWIATRIIDHVGYFAGSGATPEAAVQSLISQLKSAKVI